MKIKQYEKFEISAKSAVLTSPSGKSFNICGFEIISVDFNYDEKGIETVVPAGEKYSVIRFYPDEIGIWKYEADSISCEFDCVAGECHGYVSIDSRNGRYFCYSDGTPFFPIGINLAFISPVNASNIYDFGKTGKYRWLGLNQFRRWFKQCSENGVNLVRIWLAHEYLSPYLESAGKLDVLQLAKLDALLDLADEYNLKVKLTLEQFRFFDYERTANSDSYSDDVFRKFNKRLYLNDEKCLSTTEWMTQQKWRDAFKKTLKGISQRIAGNPVIFGIELWNEMNCMPKEHLVNWNREMLPFAKMLFRKQLVMNSLGSYDSDQTKKVYSDFCWDACDIKQMHRYLDQGAPYEICRNDPIDLLRDGTLALIGKNKPFFVAETGAVNDNHSGPFRFYPFDHDGLLFCDFVYTPIFAGASGCGHIWHWDERYVEAKNLYSYYSPIKTLCSDIDFAAENFVPEYRQEQGMKILLLKGLHTVIGYIRNSETNWQSQLRDLKEIRPVSAQFDLPNGEFTVINYQPKEKAAITFKDGSLAIDRLLYGVLIKIKY